MDSNTMIVANIAVLIYLAIHFTRKLNNMEEQINNLNMIIAYLVDPDMSKKIVRVDVKKD